MRNTLNILIGGEAGQGLVTIGQLLSKSLVRSGYFVVVTQRYQPCSHDRDSCSCGSFSEIRTSHTGLPIRTEQADNKQNAGQWNHGWL